MNQESLLSHIKNENRASVLQTYLKEIVYGGNDGIVTTFAVVAGFAGAGSNTFSLPILSVLIFGFANLCADGISMGLGNFLSLRSEKDVYKKEAMKELEEIRKKPDLEKKETTLILQEKGFTDEQAKTLTDIYSKNETYWLSFMMSYELELPNPSSENPILTGLATFLSFVIFGFIPLFPYILLSQGSDAFFLSTITTAGALLLLGLLRWRITKEPIIRSVGEIILIGSLASIAAYTVGTLFRLT